MTPLQQATHDFLGTWFLPPSNGRGVNSKPYIDAMIKALEDEVKATKAKELKHD